MIQFAEFTRFPGAGLREQGGYSGQQFREDILTPALRTAKETGSLVVVNLDGTMGLSTAFSREAFGGLVSRDGFTSAELKALLVIEGEDPSSSVFIKEAWEYIASAKPAAVH
ncbi:STAS-like domain-containing protein [Mesorhizobium sp. B2-3-4]|uniref:STAS-like domain-containing protein n=1 Tax=Mesorhizobium sp. B2-3-4 TaxID=2589959 RepID=UPI0015E3B737|nr:STAS-like domain-containing protein [Mesorhizobium sp. B2-3-4]